MDPGSCASVCVCARSVILYVYGEMYVQEVSYYICAGRCMCEKCLIMCVQGDICTRSVILCVCWEMYVRSVLLYVCGEMYVRSVLLCMCREMYVREVSCYVCTGRCMYGKCHDEVQLMFILMYFDTLAVGTENTKVNKKEKQGISLKKHLGLKSNKIVLHLSQTCPC